MKHQKLRASPIKKASALLLSFFMMSLLILTAIVVSGLVIRDVRAVRTMVAGLQSRYAAEGMSELGLHTVKENLPGYETSFFDYAFTSEALASLEMSLEMTARESTVPCSFEGEGWRALAPGESVQLALFAQADPDGTTIDYIPKFYVEFYLGDKEGNAVFPPRDNKGNSTDVLRWKILGLTDSGFPVAMSEYIPLQETRNSRLTPTLFGSSIPSEVSGVGTGYTYGKFYDESGYYGVFHETYSIEEFIAKHKYDYLVLTNVVQRITDNFIYFRFHAVHTDAVCEFVKLASQGDQEFGEARQSLETFVKEGENLPVFDFVLYHTDIND